MTAHPGDEDRLGVTAREGARQKPMVTSYAVQKELSSKPQHFQVRTFEMGSPRDLPATLACVPRFSPSEHLTSYRSSGPHHSPAPSGPLWGTSARGRGAIGGPSGCAPAGTGLAPALQESRGLLTHKADHIQGEISCMGHTDKISRGSLGSSMAPP